MLQAKQNEQLALIEGLMIRVNACWHIFKRVLEALG